MTSVKFSVKEKLNLVKEAINKNQECFAAYWVLQNPDKNIDDYTLVHGFQGNQYTFSIERKDKYES